LDDIIKTRKEIKSELEEEARSEGSTTSVGGGHIQRRIYADYIDVTRPVTLVGQKENAYIAYATGNTEEKIVKTKSRGRQILARLNRDINMLNEHGLIPHEYELKASMKHGMPLWEEHPHNRMPKNEKFIKRKVLEDIFNTRLVSPALSIPRSYFSSVGSRRSQRRVMLPIQEQIDDVSTNEGPKDVQASLERLEVFDELNTSADTDTVSTFS